MIPITNPEILEKLNRMEALLMTLAIKPDKIKEILWDETLRLNAALRRN